MAGIRKGDLKKAVEVVTAAGLPVRRVIGSKAGFEVVIGEPEGPEDRPIAPAKPPTAADAFFGMK